MRPSLLRKLASLVDCAASPSRYAALVAMGLLAACSSSGTGHVERLTPPGTGASDGGTPAADASSDTVARSEVGAPSDAGNMRADTGVESSAPSDPVDCPPSWTTTPSCGGGAASSGAVPDFGPNVLIFDDSMPMSSIQTQLDTVNGQMEADQFGTGRYAYFFKPGHYALDVRVGFYTQVLGLGPSPDDVVITGAVRSKADWLGSNNATCNFWRGAENFSVVPTEAIDSAVDIWAISQGTELRRAHIRGDMALDDGGWSSGGFIADSKIDDQIRSGSQQQFLTRNDDLNDWEGSNWNMVFVGDGQAPAASWPNPPYTVTSKTPRIREKPFLYLDASGNYAVMVPALKSDSQGSSWADGTPPGSPIAIDNFYLAKAGTDTDETLNAALAAGKNLIFTPGIYHLGDTLQVARAGTVVLGLGLATLIPDNGNAVLSVADVDGVTVGGLIVEAGVTSSPVLVQIGVAGSAQDHAKNPSAIYDLSCRIGGADVGTADNCVTIDSNDVIVDNTWLWRADHGAGADWNTNKSKNGIIVNGTGVTIYGLFVEHFQEYQTLWNGDGGSVYFYQSELPYDPPTQDDWREGPGINGYASYKVADSVTSHQAFGLGVYSVFTNDVQADNAIETPTGDGVTMRDMVTVSLASGSINHIINGTGGTVAQGGTMVATTEE